MDRGGWEVPSLDDVRAAQRRIARYLRPTPLYNYPALDLVTGAETWVKHENHQPIGAFKVRGGINLVAQLSDAEKAAGVIAASTGNHGQSVAYAARLFGVRAIVCAPQGANPVKVESMRALGAEVIMHGADFDEARERAEELAERHGYRYIHSGNEPFLVAGVATEALEILEDNPGVELIFVPIGGGSGAAGCCVVTKALRPHARVVGVQSEAAPAAYISWKERRVAHDRMGTFAEGLATRVGFEFPQQILWEHLDDFVLVSEGELKEATLTMIEKTKNLVEPAGAAALAGALKRRHEIEGTAVALVCSGGNMSPAQLRDLFSS